MIDPQMVRELAARAIMAERTVKRCYAGDSVYSSTWHRLAKAAQELGYPMPPKSGGDEQTACAEA